MNTNDWCQSLLLVWSRNCHSEVPYKKTFLKVFTKFTQESTCNASGSSSKVFSSMLAVAYDSYEWVLTKCNFCDLIANVYSVLCQTSSEAVTRRCSVKKAFLKILQNSQEAGLRHATLLKKSVWCSCFLVNFAKFLRTPFFTEHLRWLLLHIWWNFLRK